MKDFNYQGSLDNDNRVASGSIKVLDYEKFVGAKASGSILVKDYTKLIGAKATGSILVTNYTALTGKTFTIGTDILTEGVDFTAGTSNASTAESLKDAIHALSSVDATRSSDTVNIVSATTGRAGNAITLASNAESGYTFSADNILKGGLDEATITVGTDVLVQGTDFTASTDNATTAESIKDAIHALTPVVATRSTATVNIEAVAVGVAGNIALEATWDNMTVEALTLSGATLEGGVDQGQVVFGTDTLVQGTDFTASTDNATTATDLASAIDGISGFTASVDLVDDTLILIVCDAVGSAGNVVTTTNAPDAITITQMSGGADYFYSDSFDYDLIGNSAIELTVAVDTLSGGAVDCFVDVSFDKDTWEEVYQFDTFGADGSQTVKLTEIKQFARLRFSITAGETANVKVKGATSMYGGDADKMTTKVEGDYTILDDGLGAPDVPVAISTTSVNFEYIDLQADIANAGNITLGEVILIPGASKRFVADNLLNIIITNGTIGDKVIWNGMKK